MRRSSLFTLIISKMMTVSTLFVIQFFFLFVLSNKVYLNPLQTLQSTNIVKYEHCNFCRANTVTQKLF